MGGTRTSPLCPPLGRSPRPGVGRHRQPENTTKTSKLLNRNRRATERCCPLLLRPLALLLHLLHVLCLALPARVVLRLHMPDVVLAAVAIAVTSVGSRDRAAPGLATPQC